MANRFRCNYDGLNDEVSERTSLSMVNPDTGELDVGRTQQEFREECDINEIVRRFGLTGQLPEVVNIPVSGDFTGISDFQSAQNAVIKARDDFMALPAALRARFQNDPQQLLEFMAHDENRAEAEKLGLVNAKPAPVRDVVTAVDELAAKITAKPGA